MSILVCSDQVVLPDDDDSEEDVNAICALETNEEDWCQLIIEYLEHGKLPSDPRHKTEIRQRAPRFLYYNEMLYQRSFHSLWLQYLDIEEVKQAMEEPHSCVCGAHQSGPKLHDHIKRMGCYWLTKVKDCIDYAKRYDACQFHANFIHQPLEPLHPTVASWHFEAWGLYVGPITPKSFVGRSYILTTTDYFSKWTKAVPLRKVKKKNAVDFIKTHLIYRYGVSRSIITDNSNPFLNSLMTSLCKKFKFAQHKSSMYNFLQIA